MPGLAAAVAHLAFSLFCRFALDFQIEEPLPLGRVWQLAPLQSLEGDLLGVLSTLHMQPPLFNALVAGLVKFFGVEGTPSALYTLNMLCGAAICFLAERLTFALTGRPRVALAVAFLLAFHPALVLYEAYPLYDILTALLVTLCAWAFIRPVQSRVFLILLPLSLAALMMSRSFYHPLLFLPLGALCLSRRPPKRTFLIAWALMLAIPLAWCGKNLVQFGFFGVSSGFGMNLSRAALVRLLPSELEALRAEGLVSPLVAAYPASEDVVRRPPLYGSFGHARAAPHPLSGGPDLNNLNILSVDREYREAAIAALTRYPLRYLHVVRENYWTYSWPAAYGRWVRPNANRLDWYAALWSALVEGALLGRGIDALTGHAWVPSFRFLALPLALLFYAASRIRALLRAPRGTRLDALGADSAMTLLWLLLLYSALVAILFESGESYRFALYTEPLWLIFAATLLSRALAARRPPTAPSTVP